MPPNLAQILEGDILLRVLEQFGIFAFLAVAGVLIYFWMTKAEVRNQAAYALQSETISKIALSMQTNQQEMVGRYDKLKDELGGVRVELAKAQGIQSVLQDTLTNERQEWTRERTALLNQINELKLQLRLVENDMKVLQGAIQNKNTEIDDLKRLKDKIEGQLQAQIDVRSKEADALQLKISELEAKLNSQKIELERAKHEAIYGNSGVIGDGAESGVSSGSTKQSESEHSSAHPAGHPDTGISG